MKIKSFTYYNIPSQEPFIAVSDGTLTYEVTIFNLMATLCKQDKALFQYGVDHTMTYDMLYHDLISLGYPIQDKLKEYILQPSWIDYNPGFPTEHYDLVIKVYRKTANLQECHLVQSLLTVPIDKRF